MMTTPASAALGINAITGDRNSAASTATSALVMQDNCVRAPVPRFVAVCEAPPPDGNAPRNPPTTLPAPVANNSTLGLSGGSSERANARLTAIVSVKLMSAIPSAPGHMASAIDRSGRRKDGNPEGTAPTNETPLLCSAQIPAAAIAAPSTISGAGHFGRNFLMSASTTMEPTPITAVISIVFGSASMIDHTSRKNPSLWILKPNSLGTWSATITKPMPALNPTCTG